MALLSVFLLQAAVQMVDRSHHAAGLAHAASPFAGVLVEAGQHHFGQDVSPGGASGQDASDTDGAGPHHHADCGASAIITDALISSVAVSHSDLPPRPPSARVAGLGPDTSERPPKIVLDTVA